MAEGDAFVFVTPEYNHLPPSSLINAMTYFSREWNYKAAGFVSYGGISGGVRAVQAVKLLLAALRMLPALESIAIANVSAHLNSDGSFISHDAMKAVVGPLLRELERLADGPQSLRPNRIQQLQTAPER